MERGSRSEDQKEKTPGDLLATVCFADTRWLSADQTKALLIFERCLVYSRTGGSIGRRFTALLTHSTRRWYEERVAADANRDLSELVAAHPRNWIVWSTDVVKWDLRAGIGASRLRLELVDGTRRKVLLSRYYNSLPAIRVALHRTLAAPRSPVVSTRSRSTRSAPRSTRGESSVSRRIVDRGLSRPRSTLDRRCCLRPDPPRATPGPKRVAPSATRQSHLRDQPPVG